MEEDDKIAPSKRKRFEDSPNELQKIINAKDEVIEELTAEIEKLRGKVDELVKTMHGSFFIKDALNADNIQTEKANKSRKKMNKKKKTSTDKGAGTSGQPSAETGDTVDATNLEDTTDFSDMDVGNTPEGAATSPKIKVNDKQMSRSKSVPIITTYNINIKEITAVIDRTLGHGNYNLKVMGKNATNIGVCTLDDFEKIKTLLKERGVNFYTYTPKGQRPFSVVVEGLSGTYTEEDVLEYLKGLEIRVNILGLVKLNGDRWLLRLSRDSDVSAFYSVRYVLRCRVYMRKYRRGVITQCFNCQRFGHVSTNCQMPYRCVKCGNSHGPGKCDIPKRGENTKETLITDPVTGQAVRKIGLPVRCVNCNVEGHAASSRECPRRVELLRKVQEKRASRGESNRERQPPVSMVRHGVSYASAVASKVPDGPLGATPRAATTGPNLVGALSEFESVDRDCRRFFGGGLLACIGKIGGFAREYRSLRDDESRSRALLGMLMMLRHDD